MQVTHDTINDIIIATIPIMDDNYAFVISNKQHSLVVDPGTEKSIAKYLTKHGLTISAILNTHQHGDHIGGNHSLRTTFGGTIIGGDRQRDVGKQLTDGETEAFAGIQVQCINTPGHTSDSVSFYLPEQQALFTGDTLFACGCGRLFGSSAPTMWKSLQRLRELPDDTRIYCGHEYTMDNITFALTVEPNSEALLAYKETIQARLKDNRPSIPTLLGDEKKVNPFLRADTPELATALNMPNTDPEKIFTELRQCKNYY